LTIHIKIIIAIKIYLSEKKHLIFEKNMFDLFVGIHTLLDCIHYQYKKSIYLIESQSTVLFL